jgi:DNA polymerase III, subunit gamma and tau
MTYLVLARKWRPRSFDTLVGQDHVVRALTHALETQRLHHAWLFTGTRGVGKTTLSRILAKSLNCEKGITAHPCGQCRACVEIDAGRYVDYVELDAASNRGVDEMTQLLEQAIYAPSSARFKVYMIDEVHMLTGHAFNAMLKTLEEPPPHVKFILATTDPQKIPVTVLSRCLQFNLKHMTVDAIVSHLDSVLQHEQIGFEVPALRLLAQAAGGSMRDALSLTDQAIAYSAGNLTLEAVRGMLGTIDQRHLVRLLHGLSRASATDVLAVADELASRGLSYSGALGDLAVLLSHVAIHQRVPGVLPSDDPQAQDIGELASVLHPDLVQLYYSIAVHSRSELSLAPDEYAGFVMACLRMLSLTPEPEGLPPTSPGRRTASEPDSSAESNSGHASDATVQASSASSERQPASLVQSKPVPKVPAAAAIAPAARDDGPEIPAWEDLAPGVDVNSQVQKPDMAELEKRTPSAGPLDEPSDVRSDPSVDAGFVAPRVQPLDEERDAPPAQPLAAETDAPPVQPLAVETDASPVQPLDARSDVSAESQSELQVGPGSGPSDVDPQDTLYAESPVFADDGDWEPVLDDGGYESSVMAPLPGEMGDGFETEALAALAPKERDTTSRTPRLAKMSAQEWPTLAASLPATGLAAELARESEWVGVEGDTIVLRVAIHSLAAQQGLARLRTVLTEHFGKVVQLRIEFGATGDSTARAVETKLRAERQKAAEETVANDPFIHGLMKEFGAQVIPGSISALDNERVA